MHAVTPRELLALLRVGSSRAVLAIDHGSRKVGLAVCEDVSQPAPRGVGVLRAPLGSSAGDGQALLAGQVAAVARAHRVGGIVLGWSLDPQGRETPQCAAAADFVLRLRGLRVHAPVVLWDERGSSVAAREALREEAGESRAGRPQGARLRPAPLAPELRRHVDERAALVILQSFLAAACPPTPTPPGLPARLQ